MNIYLFAVDLKAGENYGTRLAIVVAKNEAEARQKVADRKLMFGDNKPDLLQVEKVRKSTPVIVFEQYE